MIQINLPIGENGEAEKCSALREDGKCRRER
jgi:hypothetical protein